MGIPIQKGGKKLMKAIIIDLEHEETKININGYEEFENADLQILEDIKNLLFFKPKITIKEDRK